MALPQTSVTRRRKHFPVAYFLLLLFHYPVQKGESIKHGCVDFVNVTLRTMTGNVHFMIKIPTKIHVLADFACLVFVLDFFFCLFWFVVF